KFSGTLVHHTHRRDPHSATTSAFAHLVFGYSKRTLVVVDLQGNFVQYAFTSLIHPGTPCLVRNNDGFILFDLITHTADGCVDQNLFLLVFIFIASETRESGTLDRRHRDVCS
ncbi:hypothetical protein DFH08DRAFT_724777, partial [Mycena albidolilacea]